YFSNKGARPGDTLVLTKPLGVGILTTALKQDLLTEKQASDVTDVMRTLNKAAAEIAQQYDAHAVTDVTGFGLLGHAYEMAHSSDLSFVIENDSVPLLERTKELAQKRVIPGGSKANHQ